MGAIVSSLAAVTSVSIVLWASRIFSKPPREPPPQVKKAAERLAAPPAAPPPQVQKEPAPAAPPPQAPPPQVKTPEILIREAREKIGVDCIKYYNFAVGGQTGVGKSSFVNACLSLEEAGACAVGEVETTQEIRSYSCKKWPSLKVWDIPGAATRNHPASTYFKDKMLYVFDAILILTAERFLEVDFDILRSAREFDTPCVFVRTKCEISVENRAKRDKVNALEASRHFRAEVTQSFHENLVKVGLMDASQIAPRLYFISNLFLGGEVDAYSICDKKTKSWDNSLSSMDEEALLKFLLDAAKSRA